MIGRLLRRRASRDRCIHLQQLRKLSEEAHKRFLDGVRGTLGEIGAEPTDTLCLACGAARPAGVEVCPRCQAR
jgi:hypothetical protein